MNFWPRLFYDTLIRALSPLLLIHTIHQSFKRKGGWRFISQRMGWVRSQSINTKRSIWVHAASVGEVRTVIPLLRYISDTHPSIPITVSCNTPEAHNTLEGANLDVTSRYCAIDFPAATRALFREIQPDWLILVETEIWPRMLHQAGLQNVPVLIVNGRLSEKTTNAPNIIKALYRQALENVSCVLARSTSDVTRFINLGVHPEKIVSVGNLKSAYRRNTLANPISELRSFPYILAVSTHSPEEQILTEIVQKLPKSILLVLVPRHPQRSLELQQLLREQSLSFAVRSKQQMPTTDTQVYLADTTGEMDALLSEAVAVYMGGTLAPIGGHNLLEPAAWGRAIVCGESLSNFEAEADLLQHHQALWIVEDKTALLDALSQLIASPELRVQMGTAASTAFESVQHSFDNYKTRVSDFIDNYAQNSSH